MILIGIGHKARQGKDTFANAIRSASPKDTKVYSFANELKLYCRDNHEALVKAYPFVELDQKPDPIYGYTKMLQYVGTEVERKKDPNCWVKKVSDRIDKENPEVSVISDVRFPNEANWIKSKGGILIKILRLMPDGSNYIDPSRDPNHASEISLDNYPFDLVIGVPNGKTEYLVDIASVIVATRAYDLADSVEVD